MSESSTEFPRPPASHQVDDLVEQCLQLLRAIAPELAEGRVPAEELARVEVIASELLATGQDAPVDTAAMERLCNAFTSAAQQGTDWLERKALPELESLAQGVRGRQVYQQRSASP